MNNDKNEKIKLRKNILKIRDNIPENKRIEFSINACQHANEMTQLINAAKKNMVIAGFLPIKSEIDPRPLMSELKQLGAKLCLPVVVGTREIEFRELKSEDELKPAGFGTVGPSENAEVMMPDVLLVPLSVFDKNGGRIGYGKGYYDTAIQKLRKDSVETSGEPLLVGMAFDEQETDKVPMEKHDCKLHFIVTQKGVIETQKIL